MENKKLKNAIAHIENCLACYCEDSISDDKAEQKRVNAAWYLIIQSLNLYGVK